MNKPFMRYNSQDINWALDILFPDDKRRSLIFLNQLGLDKLKEAYRLQLYKSHPDRSVILSTDPEKLSEAAKDINRSYSLLKDYIKGKKLVRLISSPFRRIRTHSAQSSGRGTKRTQSENLLLGRYLLYRGIIDFKQLLKVLTWQITIRPNFGRIARDLGYCTDEDTARIVKNRRKNEKFGDTALRLNILSEMMIKHIISYQKRIQPKIGEYLVKEGILTGKELTEYIEELKEFNKRS
jgi:hypothetical protein